jgi:hypothetical protein
MNAHTTAHSEKPNGMQNLKLLKPPKPKIDYLREARVKRESKKLQEPSAKDWAITLEDT